MTVKCQSCGLEASEDAFWLPADTEEQLFCSSACLIDARDHDFTTEEGWTAYIDATSPDPDLIYEDEIDLELMAKRLLGTCKEHDLEKPCGLCGDDLGWVVTRLVAACREIARRREG